MGNAATVRLGNAEYVILPKEEYDRLRRARRLPVGTVDAVDHARATIGRGLRAAREHAGLTQEALAAKLGKSQTLVSHAEGGRTRVSERYVKAVLKACGLPADWKP